MSLAADLEAWLATDSRHLGARLWRATLAAPALRAALVEHPADQATLDALLGISPASPDSASTRYSTVAALIDRSFTDAAPHASRFGGAREPGIWYGAREKRIAFAEAGYWYLRFVLESPALQAINGPMRTVRLLHSADIAGMAVDLSVQPWSEHNEQWTDPNDYSHCQVLARAARAAGIQWIQYISTRDPHRGLCAAALRRDAVQPGVSPKIQTWICGVPDAGQAKQVQWQQLQGLFADAATAESYTFDFGADLRSSRCP